MGAQLDKEATFRKAFSRTTGAAGERTRQRSPSCIDGLIMPA
jgi:hypothetical protein